MAATGTDTRNQPPEERTEQKPEPQENSDPDSKPATGTAKEEAAERERKNATQTQPEGGVGERPRTTSRCYPGVAVVCGRRPFGTTGAAPRGGG